MKKILVVSDNHGHKEKIEKILQIEKYDLAIHLGDSEIYDNFIEENFDYYVRGNNDQNNFPEIDTFKFANFKFAIAHGHTLGINNIYFMFKKGINKNALKYCLNHEIQIFLFGHTHIPFFKKINQIYFFNPGSISFPRSSDGPTYGILIIDKNNIKPIWKKM